MKKTSKLILSLAMSAAVAFGVIGIAACTSGENGKSAYEIAVEHGFQGTEAEWLESLKGQSPKAPEIEIGENGNWFIDGVDTGVKAKGENGTNGTNGKDGIDGTNGKTGNGWLYGNGEPINELGKTGDLYLDLDTGDIWTKEETGWEFKMCLIPEEPEEPGEEFSVAAGASEEYDINLEPGIYEITFKVAEGTVVDQGLMAKVIDETADISFDLYDGLNETYHGILQVRAGNTKFSLTNGTEGTICGTYKIAEYKIPTLKADGKEYVIPQFAFGEYNEGSHHALYLPVESSVTGTCKITLSNVQGGQRGAIGVYKNGIDGVAPSGTINRVGSVKFNDGLIGEFDFTGVNTLLFKSPKAAMEFNLTIKIEPIN